LSLGWSQWLTATDPNTYHEQTRDDDVSTVVFLEFYWLVETDFGSEMFEKT
jgi:hypothetical protein